MGFKNMGFWYLALVLCIRFAVILCTSHTNDYSSHIPAYAIASRANLINSTTCRMELRIFRDAVDKQVPWGIKVLDSSGQPGKLLRNRFWTGSYYECFDSMNETPLLLSRQLIQRNNNVGKEFPPFKVNYFVAYVKYNSTLCNPITAINEDLLTLGLCLPSSCSTNDVSFLVERIFDDRILFIGNFYSMNFDIVEVKSLKDQWPFTDTTHYIVIGIVALTLLMMIIGTIYDIFVFRKYLNMNSDNGSVHRKMPEDKIKTIALSIQQENTIGKILICFSVYTNTIKLFDTNLQKDEIPSIHGLRFFSMNHLLTIHSFFFLCFYVDNLRSFLKLSEGFIIQIISNGTVSVDTFFVQSGFLLGYLHVRKTQDIANKPCKNRMMLKQLCISIVTRFIRLTPAYMMVLGIVQLNWTWYDKNTQFYMHERPETCAKYWWRNILYINNLYKKDELCMIWSWYMACDMQNFIICKALLILSAVYFRTTISILGTLFVGSIALSGYMSYTYEHVPTVYEIIFVHPDIVYYAPWVRLSPYIVGVIGGYVLAKKNTQLNLKKKTVILCWCLAAAGNISILFALYDRNVSVLFVALYNALSKPLWAMGIVWIITACLIKHGGILNRVLSFNGWILGSRLSYCAYLVNPLVIYSFYQNSETIVHSDKLIIFLQGVGIIASTYVCSFAITLMAEIPYNSLLQLFFQSGGTIVPSSSITKKRL